MHKVFISYHHSNDQWYKDELVRVCDGKLFIDCSVDIGDINEDLSAETIRTKIRDEYLRDSSITIVLVGKCTKHRKHVDWEIGSSMYDGPINKKSGIVVIELPSGSNGLNSGIGSLKLKNEIDSVKKRNWDLEKNSNHRERHPFVPEKIIKNIGQNIPIIQWKDICENINILKEAIQYAYDSRLKNEYSMLEFRDKNGYCE